VEAFGDGGTTICTPLPGAPTGSASAILR